MFEIKELISINYDKNACVLKGGPKISDPTKRHDTTFNLFKINGTLP